jgi:nucleotide-binding universal stress UspA family protein
LLIEEKIILFKRIIVAIDSSQTSDQVFDALENLNLNSNPEIIFTSVLPSSESQVNLPFDKPLNLADSFAQHKEEELKTYQVKYPYSKIEVTRGDPAEEILRLANIYQADLIIIGSRGLKGIERILENSVSSQVVADSPCSVFVVRP